MHRDVFEDAWRAEIIETQDHRRNRSEHRRAAAVLVEGVDTKPRELRNLEREVSLQELFEVLALLVVHDVVNHTVHFFVLQWWHVDSLDVAVNANDRRDTRRQVQVRSVVLDGKCEQLRNIDRGHSTPYLGHAPSCEGLYKKLTV